MTIIIIHVLHIIIILHAEPMWYTIPGNTILLPGNNILSITVQVWSFESWLERKWIREEMTEVGDNS